jgi:pimeloyl-ACP methyl ester carboxylesterase
MQLDISFDFVEVNKKSLRIQKIIHPNAGEKPFLVFLHEGLGCIELWKQFPQILSSELECNALVYDRQGYGQSSPLSALRGKDYLEIEAREFLPELLNKLDIKKPILIGHSDGGSIALIYASLYECTAMITEAAHIFVEEITLNGIQEAKNNPDLPLIFKKLEKYHGEKTEAIFKAWTDTWLNEAFHDWNISAYLKNIICPSLIIQGLDDEYASPVHVEKIMDNLSSCTVKKAFLPANCAHIPHLQAAEEVKTEIVSFLKKVLN